MVRPVLTELILFLTPFALYALYLFATKRGQVLEAANWPLSRVLSLLIVAFAIVIASFIVLAQWGGAPPRSDYTPAHLEGEKFVPGRNK